MNYFKFEFLRKKKFDLIFQFLMSNIFLSYLKYNSQNLSKSFFEVIPFKFFKTMKDLFLIITLFTSIEAVQ